MTSSVESLYEMFLSDPDIVATATKSREEVAFGEAKQRFIQSMNNHKALSLAKSGRLEDLLSYLRYGALTKGPRDTMHVFGGVHPETGESVPGVGSAITMPEDAPSSHRELIDHLIDEYGQLHGGQPDHPDDEFLPDGEKNKSHFPHTVHDILDDPELSEDAQNVGRIPDAALYLTGLGERRREDVAPSEQGEAVGDVQGQEAPEEDAAPTDDDDDAEAWLREQAKRQEAQEQTGEEEEGLDVKSAFPGEDPRAVGANETILEGAPVEKLVGHDALDELASRANTPVAKARMAALKGHVETFNNLQGVMSGSTYRHTTPTGRVSMHDWATTSPEAEAKGLRNDEGDVLSHREYFEQRRMAALQGIGDGLKYARDNHEGFTHPSLSQTELGLDHTHHFSPAQDWALRNATRNNEDVSPEFRENVRQGINRETHMGNPSAIDDLMARVARNSNATISPTPEGVQNLDAAHRAEHPTGQTSTRPVTPLGEKRPEDMNIHQLGEWIIKHPEASPHYIADLWNEGLETGQFEAEDVEDMRKALTGIPMSDEDYSTLYADGEKFKSVEQLEQEHKDAMSEHGKIVFNPETGRMEFNEELAKTEKARIAKLYPSTQDSRESASIDAEDKRVTGTYGLNAKARQARTYLETQAARRNREGEIQGFSREAAYKTGIGEDGFPIGQSVPKGPGMDLIPQGGTTVFPGEDQLKIHSMDEESDYHRFRPIMQTLITLGVPLEDFTHEDKSTGQRVWSMHHFERGMKKWGFLNEDDTLKPEQANPYSKTGAALNTTPVIMPGQQKLRPVGVGKDDKEETFTDGKGVERLKGNPAKPSSSDGRAIKYVPVGSGASQKQIAMVEQGGPGHQAFDRRQALIHHFNETATDEQKEALDAHSYKVPGRDKPIPISGRSALEFSLDGGSSRKHPTTGEFHIRPGGRLGQGAGAAGEQGAWLTAMGYQRETVTPGLSKPTQNQIKKAEDNHNDVMANYAHAHQTFAAMPSGTAEEVAAKRQYGRTEVRNAGLAYRASLKTLAGFSSWNPKTERYELTKPAPFSLPAKPKENFFPRKGKAFPGETIEDMAKASAAVNRNPSTWTAEERQLIQNHFVRPTAPSDPHGTFPSHHFETSSDAPEGRRIENPQRTSTVEPWKAEWMDTGLSYPEFYSSLGGRTSEGFKDQWRDWPSGTRIPRGANITPEYVRSLRGIEKTTTQAKHYLSSVLEQAADEHVIRTGKLFKTEEYLKDELTPYPVGGEYKSPLRPTIEEHLRALAEAPPPETDSEGKPLSSEAKARITAAAKERAAKIPQDVAYDPTTGQMVPTEASQPSQTSQREADARGREEFPGYHTTIGIKREWDKRINPETGEPSPVGRPIHELVATANHIRQKEMKAHPDTKEGFKDRLRKRFVEAMKNRGGQFTTDDIKQWAEEEGHVKTVPAPPPSGKYKAGRGGGREVPEADDGSPWTDDQYEPVEDWQTQFMGGRQMTRQELTTEQAEETDKMHAALKQYEGLTDADKSKVNRIARQRRQADSQKTPSEKLDEALRNAGRIWSPYSTTGTPPREDGSDSEEAGPEQPPSGGVPPTPPTPSPTPSEGTPEAPEGENGDGTPTPPVAQDEPEEIGGAKVRIPVDVEGRTGVRRVNEAHQNGEGISMLRPPNAQQRNDHYGNPFGVGDRTAGVYNVGTGQRGNRNAVNAHDAWLHKRPEYAKDSRTGEDLLDGEGNQIWLGEGEGPKGEQPVKPEQRDWILKQITSGALNNKSLLYHQHIQGTEERSDGTRRSHASNIEDMVNIHKGIPQGTTSQQEAPATATPTAQPEAAPTSAATEGGGTLDDIISRGGFTPDEVRRFSSRDIIKVPLADGSVQPFYRSTGRNSNKPGEWLPFDGLGGHPRAGDGWFNKHRFTADKREGGLEDGLRSPDHPLHRFGTEELKALSAQLGNMDIPQGEEFQDPKNLNEWLGDAALVNAPGAHSEEQPLDPVVASPEVIARANAGEQSPTPAEQPADAAETDGEEVPTRVEAPTNTHPWDTGAYSPTGNEEEDQASSLEHTPTGGNAPLTGGDDEQTKKEFEDAKGTHDKAKEEYEALRVPLEKKQAINKEALDKANATIDPEWHPLNEKIDSLERDIHHRSHPTPEEKELVKKMVGKSESAMYLPGTPREDYVQLKKPFVPFSSEKEYWDRQQVENAEKDASEKKELAELDSQRKTMLAKMVSKEDFGYVPQTSEEHLAKRQAFHKQQNAYMRMREAEALTGEGRPLTQAQNFMPHPGTPGTTEGELHQFPVKPMSDDDAEGAGSQVLLSELHARQANIQARHEDIDEQVSKAPHDESWYSDLPEGETLTPHASDAQVFKPYKNMQQFMQMSEGELEREKRDTPPITGLVRERPGGDPSLGGPGRWGAWITGEQANQEHRATIRDRKIKDMKSNADYAHQYYEATHEQLAKSLPLDLESNYGIIRNGGGITVDKDGNDVSLAGHEFAYSPFGERNYGRYRPNSSGGTIGLLGGAYTDRTQDGDENYIDAHRPSGISDEGYEALKQRVHELAANRDSAPAQHQFSKEVGREDPPFTFDGKTISHKGHFYLREYNQAVDVLNELASLNPRRFPPNQRDGLGKTIQDRVNDIREHTKHYGEIARQRLYALGVHDMDDIKDLDGKGQGRTGTGSVGNDAHPFKTMSSKDPVLTEIGQGVDRGDGDIFEGLREGDTPNQIHLNPATADGEAAAQPEATPTPAAQPAAAEEPAAVEQQPEAPTEAPTIDSNRMQELRNRVEDASTTPGGVDAPSDEVSQPDSSDEGLVNDVNNLTAEIAKTHDEIKNHPTMDAEDKDEALFETKNLHDKMTEHSLHDENHSAHSGVSTPDNPPGTESPPPEGMNDLGGEHVEADPSPNEVTSVPTPSRENVGTMDDDAKEQYMQDIVNNLLPKMRNKSAENYLQGLRDTIRSQTENDTLNTHLSYNQRLGTIDPNGNWAEGSAIARLKELESDILDNNLSDVGIGKLAHWGNGNKLFFNMVGIEDKDTNTFTAFAPGAVGFHLKGYDNKKWDAALTADSPSGGDERAELNRLYVLGTQGKYDIASYLQMSHIDKDPDSPTFGKKVQLSSSEAQEKARQNRATIWQTAHDEGYGYQGIHGRPPVTGTDAGKYGVPPTPTQRPGEQGPFTTETAGEGGDDNARPNRSGYNADHSKAGFTSDEMDAAEQTLIDAFPGERRRIEQWMKRAVQHDPSGRDVIAEAKRVHKGNLMGDLGAHLKGLQEQQPPTFTEGETNPTAYARQLIAHTNLLQYHNKRPVDVEAWQDAYGKALRAGADVDRLAKEDEKYPGALFGSSLHMEEAAQQDYEKHLQHTQVEGELSNPASQQRAFENPTHNPHRSHTFNNETGEHESTRYRQVDGTGKAKKREDNYDDTSPGNPPLIPHNYPRRDKPVPAAPEVIADLQGKVDEAQSFHDTLKQTHEANLAAAAGHVETARTLKEGADTARDSHDEAVDNYSKVIADNSYYSSVAKEARDKAQITKEAVKTAENAVDKHYDDNTKPGRDAVIASGQDFDTARRNLDNAQQSYEDGRVTTGKDHGDAPFIPGLTKGQTDTYNQLHNDVQQHKVANGVDAALPADLEQRKQDFHDSLPASHQGHDPTDMTGSMVNHPHFGATIEEKTAQGNHVGQDWKDHHAEKARLTADHAKLKDDLSKIHPGQNAFAHEGKSAEVDAAQEKLDAHTASWNTRGKMGMPSAEELKGSNPHGDLEHHEGIGLVSKSAHNAILNQLKGHEGFLHTGKMANEDGSSTGITPLVYHNDGITPKENAKVLITHGGIHPVKHEREYSYEKHGALDEHDKITHGLGRSLHNAIISSHPDVEEHANGYHIKNVSTVLPEHQVHPVTKQTFPSSASQPPPRTPRQSFKPTPSGGGNALSRLRNFASGVSTKAGGAIASEQMASAMGQSAAGLPKVLGGKDLPKTSPIGLHSLIGEGIKRTGMLGAGAKQSATEAFYDRVQGPANKALRNEGTSPSTPPPPSSPF